MPPWSVGQGQNGLSDVLRMSVSFRSDCSRATKRSSKSVSIAHSIGHQGLHHARCKHEAQKQLLAEQNCHAVSYAVSFSFNHVVKLNQEASPHVNLSGCIAGGVLHSFISLKTRRIVWQARFHAQAVDTACLVSLHKAGFATLSRRSEQLCTAHGIHVCSLSSGECAGNCILQV